MRIFLVSGHFELCNMGDVTMLQVAVARLKTLWPNAVIEVPTARPDSLKWYCPDVSPVPVRGLADWLSDGNPFGFFSSCLPRPLSQRVVKFERYLRRRWPSIVHALMLVKSKLPGASYIDHLRVFWQALARADLVVHSGGGVINDTSRPFETLSNTILDLFALAVRHGKATAMFGQGLGPIEK